MTMTIGEGCDSLKIECALRNFGWIEYKNLIIANVGEYFVRPIGYSPMIEKTDDLFGFQIGKPEIIIKHFDFQLGYLPFSSSAKRAIEVALRGRLI